MLGVRKQSYLGTYVAWKHVFWLGPFSAIGYSLCPVSGKQKSKPVFTVWVHVPNTIPYQDLVLDW